MGPGTVLSGRFKIEERIGRGGMGAVYRAHDRLRSRYVALKVMLPSLLAMPKAVARFDNEADLMIDLTHDGIVNVYDRGFDEALGLRFYTMELLEGQSLRAWLRDRKDAAGNSTVDPADALEVTRQIVEALRYAHRKTVHRDLKPENVFVLKHAQRSQAEDEQPEDRPRVHASPARYPMGAQLAPSRSRLHVKILDFGIAKLHEAQSSFTRTNVALGTVDYMAPEQRRPLRNARALAPSSTGWS